ncbi:25S rRNA (cytosine-C(5))-methyltransferase [Lachnellula occidentalis]|uniref:25S rRNA (Cytosine-C(5))-methyltransferase n=1 Tax=Lachnellula occidentalis TaxID=215460 RepID=A0A8H8RN18_9HELO|nr:25S rRNA (cytosine-C(5))-methyltransferase [Lachnellula occidentalis]
MSLYHETAELLTAPTKAGGSLKSRIFSKKDLKSQPAQIYALAIESCKWSSVLKEVIEKADILRLEHKLTPILAVLLVHDFLLAKRGIALPAIHGLRSSVERHKGRLQSEFTKARLKRKVRSVEALKAHIEAGLENSAVTSEAPYPRWVRINTLKTTLEDQLEATFAGYERATTVEAVRQRGSKRVFIDGNIPNLVAISPSVDLSKSDAYKSGAIIFQDKASCFPAYLLDPLSEDGDIIDTCSAPGNKTTHLAAVLLSHSPEPEKCKQRIHAFEKNDWRAETLEKMVYQAGSDGVTKLYPGQDFLKTDPEAPTFKRVGALLLDPSCSGSGIIGRDDMPELHLPVAREKASTDSLKTFKKGKATKAAEPTEQTRKRKREEPEEPLDVLVDDDGMVTAVDTEDELKARLTALFNFQLELLLHSFKFPSARKITYSTCSIYAEENENVVKKALDSAIAKERGWRILKRDDQIRGMREWPNRGSLEACDGNTVLAESCIRANKGDEHGTMGFFLAGFVRDPKVSGNIEAQFIRDDQGHLVRDLMGFPVKAGSEDEESATENVTETKIAEDDIVEEQDEWGGFDDEQSSPKHEVKADKKLPEKPKKQVVDRASKHSHSAIRNRQDLAPMKKKKRKN